MVLYLEDKKLHAKKCTKPKFNDHGGRTWDSAYIKIDNLRIKCHLDTTWGSHVYFWIDPFWYKLRMFNDPFKKQNEYDLDPFSAPKLSTRSPRLSK